MASFYNRYYHYYRPYSSIPFKHSIKEDDVIQNDNSNNDISENKNQENNSSNYRSFGPVSFKSPLFNELSLEEPIFNVFGIWLYLDDIIILGLLFFLYQEGVQDEMLFIVLILLLLG